MPFVKAHHCAGATLSICRTDNGPTLVIASRSATWKVPNKSDSSPYQYEPTHHEHAKYQVPNLQTLLTANEQVDVDWMNNEQHLLKCGVDDLQRAKCPRQQNV